MNRLFRFPFLSNRQIRRDVDAELRFHFEARVEELVAQGHSPERAQAIALDEFGDVEQVREGLRAIDRRVARGRERGEWLAGLRQDAIYAVRSLRRSPGVALAVVLTLSLGLGANAAMFSLLNDVFLRPPAGIAQPDRVRRLWWEFNSRDDRRFTSGFAYPNYQAVSEALAARATTGIYSIPAPARFGRGEGAPNIHPSYASASYFALLGVRPAFGRLYAPDEDRFDAPTPVAVISHRFWTHMLGGDSAAVGRTVIVAGRAAIIVGVTQRDFAGVDLDAVDIWMPLASMPLGAGPATAPWWKEMRRNGFQILIRKNADVDDAELDERLTAVLRRPEMALSKWDTPNTARVGSIIKARGPGKLVQEVEVAKRLAGVAGIVLVIACANVVNLLLARAVRRRREIAVRLALGVSGGRLVRLLVTESALLALVAGAAAVVTAFWGGTLLRRYLLPDIHWAMAPVDWRVVAFTLAIAVLAGVASGLVPAIQSAATDLVDALKSGGREGALGTSRLRSFFVIAQAALSMVLLAGAALFTRSLSNVRHLDLGFAASRLVFAHPAFETTDRIRDSLLPARMPEVERRLRALPGVESVARTAMRPISGFSFNTYFVDGRDSAAAKPLGMFWAVSSNYFETAGTTMLRGTTFRSAGGAVPPAVIVNDAMARALWPSQDPIGRCVRFDRSDARCNTVIGVVKTARYRSVIEDPTPQFYLPLENLPFEYASGAGELVIRAREADRALVVREVRAAIRDAFPGSEPVVTEMRKVLEPQYRPWLLGARLFTAFGVLALVVAAVGIYSTVAYGVTQRIHEFGVRVALGARLTDVLRLVVGGGLRTVAIGVVIGAALAIGAGRFIASLLYGVAPNDPATMIGVGALLLIVASAAALVPARRAARVDPASALRTD